MQKSKCKHSAVRKNGVKALRHHPEAANPFSLHFAF
jgi:hypothetical protein